MNRALSRTRHRQGARFIGSRTGAGVSSPLPDRQAGEGPLRAAEVECGKPTLDELGARIATNDAVMRHLTVGMRYAQDGPSRDEDRREGGGAQGGGEQTTSAGVNEVRLDGILVERGRGAALRRPALRWWRPRSSHRSK